MSAALRVSVALLAVFVLTTPAPTAALSSADLLGVWTGSCIQQLYTSAGGDLTCYAGVFSYEYQLNFTMVNHTLMSSFSTGKSVLNLNGSLVAVSAGGSDTMQPVKFIKYASAATSACLTIGNGDGAYSQRVSVTTIMGVKTYSEQGIYDAITGLQTLQCQPTVKKLTCNPFQSSYFCTAYKSVV